MFVFEVIKVSLNCPTYIMVSTFFSCNLSAVTNGASIDLNLDYKDGNAFNYKLNDSFVIIPRYYLQTNIYNISALITNPNLNFGVFNNING